MAAPPWPRSRKPARNRDCRWLALTSSATTHRRPLIGDFGRRRARTRDDRASRVRRHAGDDGMRVSGGAAGVREPTGQIPDGAANASVCAAAWVRRRGCGVCATVCRTSPHINLKATSRPLPRPLSRPLPRPPSKPPPQPVHPMRQTLARRAVRLAQLRAPPVGEGLSEHHAGNCIPIQYCRQVPSRVPRRRHRQGLDRSPDRGLDLSPDRITG